MNWLQASLALTPPVLFLGAALVPFRDEAHRNRTAKRIVEPVAALATFVALIAVAATGLWGPVETTFVRLTSAWSPGVMLDALSATTLLLVSFVGWVALRFSVRYLDGDARQGLFLQRMCVALGAALTLGIARDFVTLAVGWTATSAALHLLLTHFSDRPRAIEAARQKFLISRLGDAFLIGGICLTAFGFGTVEFHELFALAGEPGGANSLTGGAAFLFALAALTKSAQLPFHAWLPETMEAPTPVSALMHAGIINAGGLLMIRLAPLVSLSPGSLHLLALVGAATAVFASLAMATQTSVKRSLAFSTVAQMGFMMLQCGLGAFAAAALHVVAHSLYKAHAFLSSGSVLDAAARARVGIDEKPERRSSLPSVATATVGATAIAGSAIFLFDAAAKPGGVILYAVMGTAIAHLIWSALRTRRRAVVRNAMAIAVALCFAYLGAYWLADRAFAATFSYAVPNRSPWDVAVIAAVASLFIAGFAVQTLAMQNGDRPFVRALYVHLSNGFYVDVYLRRLTSRFRPAGD